MTTGVFTIPWISTDGSRSDASLDFVTSPGHRYFLAGPENLLLQELVQAASADSPRYNPITLCGPTGVGKSHLLHGLVEHLKTWKAGFRATVLSGADFARSFVRAIEVDSVNEWRSKQLNVDLFVLDDIQELETKILSQHELVLAIDAFLDRNIQIILASRHATLDWSWMLPRLRSRLEGSLVIPVAPPSLPTQRQMVRSILSDHGLAPGNEYVLPESATARTYTQIRHLVLQHFQLSNGTSEPLPDSTSLSTRKSLQKIAKVVARQSHVKLSDLLGPSRRQSVVRCRGIAFYLARSLLRLSFQEIGCYFGSRDHTTVLHSWQKTKTRLESDVRFKHEVDKLADLLADNFEVQTP